jgi:hypothetical protein
MTIMKTSADGRNGERGNVLFLILIAVALFAALSYAVTQSSRSGGGDASSEKNLVNSSQVTQYPAGVRTSVVRMIIGGVSIEELLFDDPSNFGLLTDDALKKRGVFYPSGGGATYQIAPPDVIQGGSPTPWIFSSNYQVDKIGTTIAGNNSANDVIAFLPNVTKSLCLKLDVQLGIVTASAADAPTGEIAAPTATDNMSLTQTAGLAASPAIGTGADAAHTIGSSVASYSGQPFGCLKSTDNKYVYYHVLVER